MKPCLKGEFDQSLSAETIGNNKDLIAQVLLLVPAKSLIRFKSVSKDWFALISDSRFSINHTRKNPNPSISGIFFRPCHSYEVFPLQKQKSLPSLKILGDINPGVLFNVWNVCNGLILCSVECNSLFVCNPTTQKYIKLPKPVASVSPSSCRGLNAASLAFDPSESPHYKVLLTRCYEDRKLSRYSYEDFIYSSESASWEEMIVDGRSGVCFGGTKVFWNKAFHWINKDKTHFRFDLDKMKLTETPKPPGPQDLREIQILYNGNCGGRYFLLQTDNKTLLTSDVLEMKKDDYSWTIKHTVDFNLINCPVLKYKDYRILDNCVSVLYVLEGNGRDDLELVIATRDEVIRSYNLNTNNTEVIQHSLNRFIGLFQRKVFKHQLIESMSPV